MIFKGLFIETNKIKFFGGKSPALQVICIILINSSSCEKPSIFEKLSYKNLLFFRVNIPSRQLYVQS